MLVTDQGFFLKKIHLREQQFILKLLSRRKGIFSFITYKKTRLLPGIEYEIEYEERENKDFFPLKNIHIRSVLIPLQKYPEKNAALSLINNLWLHYSLPLAQNDNLFDHYKKLCLLLSQNSSCFPILNQTIQDLYKLLGFYNEYAFNESFTRPDDEISLLMKKINTLDKLCGFSSPFFAEKFSNTFQFIVNLNNENNSPV